MEQVSKRLEEQKHGEQSGGEDEDAPLKNRKRNRDQRRADGGSEEIDGNSRGARL